MPGQTVLIVDDEPTIAATLEYALECEGFAVDTCELGKDAIERFHHQHLSQQNYVFVVLDVGLPDLNGFEVCKAIRKTSDVPVLFLTARSDELDRIVGLEIGADDYVVKPFSPREVATRIKVILKRYQVKANERATYDEASVLSIDDEKAKVSFYGREVELTRYEFLLLKTLAAAPERVYSRGQLMDMVWPDAVASMERSVDTHIKTLRAKLRDIKPECEVVKTHRGMGYSLNRL